MLPTQIDKKLALLDEIKRETHQALSNHLDDDRLRLYYQSSISDALYELFSDWLSYERDLDKDCLTSGKILEIRQAAYAHQALEPFRYSNFAQATRVGKRENPDKFLLEPEVESSPGSPSSMYTLYNRVPKARGNHTPIAQAIIEMYDKASLDFMEVDATIQRLKRTAKIICNSIIQKTHSNSQDSNFFVLDIACGGNYLAREIKLRLDAIKQSSNLVCNVYILGVDLDSRTEKFTFKSIDQADSIGWHSLDEASSINLSFLKGNLLLKRTQKNICEWLENHHVDNFDAVVSLGIIDYFGCLIPGSSKEYIPEEHAVSFGESMLRLTAPSGLLIGAAYALEGLDPIPTGGRHLVSNWQLNHVDKSFLMGRFKFLDDSDLYDVAIPENLDVPSLREKLNKGVHFFVHRPG